MAQSFHETAHNRTDLKKFGEGIDRIFGQRPKEFCDHCGFRFSYCECNLDNEEKNDDVLRAP